MEAKVSCGEVGVGDPETEQTHLVSTQACPPHGLGQSLGCVEMGPVSLLCHISAQNSDEPTNSKFTLGLPDIMKRLSI